MSGQLSSLQDKGYRGLCEGCLWFCGEDNIVGFSVKLRPMQNHVAVAVHQALVGDVTKMKTMIIGGAGALQYRLR